MGGGGVVGALYSPLSQHSIQTNISLEPEPYAQVKAVAMQRRLQGLPDATASAVIREAILYYLER